jgi:hypothetical protein
MGFHRLRRLDVVAVKTEFVINLQTATALNIEMLLSVLGRCVAGQCAAALRDSQNLRVSIFEARARKAIPRAAFSF